MTSKSHDPRAEVQYQVAMLPQHVLYKIGTNVLVVEQEIETPLDIGSSSSSLRSSNLLVRVAELDYLYKKIYFVFTVNNFFQ